LRGDRGPELRGADVASNVSPMASILERSPERAHKDPRGRLYLRSELGASCRGTTKLTTEDVQRLMGTTYKAGDEKRVLDFVGSDETVDRAGDVIRVAGWQLGEFRRNPVILLNHDYQGLPVGQALEVKQERHEGRPVLRFSVLFADAATYPLADTVFRLYQGGYMRATSVGFIPLEAEKLSDEERESLGLKPYGNVFSKQSLLELSMVTVPANPNALELAVKRSIITPRQALQLDVRETVDLDRWFDLLKVRATLAEVKGEGWSYRVQEPSLFVADSWRLVPWEIEAPFPVSLMVGTLLEEEREDVQSVRFAEADGWTAEGVAEWVDGHLEEIGSAQVPHKDTKGEEITKPDVPPSEDRPEGFVIQSLILSKERFETEASARKWVKDHDFEDHGVDETETSWRFRQRNPDEFESIRTIELDDGVKAVGGRLKAMAPVAVRVFVTNGDLLERMALLEAEAELQRMELARLTGVVERTERRSGEGAPPDPAPEGDDANPYAALYDLRSALLEEGKT